MLHKLLGLSVLFLQLMENPSTAKRSEDNHSFSMGMIFQAFHLQRQHQAYHLANKLLFILSYRPNKLGFYRMEFSLLVTFMHLENSSIPICTLSFNSWIMNDLSTLIYVCVSVLIHLKSLFQAQRSLRLYSNLEMCQIIGDEK